MQRACWQDEPSVVVGFDDENSVVDNQHTSSSNYKRARNPWEYASKDTVELAAEDEQRRLASDYKYKEPWNISQTSSSVIRNFDKNIDLLNYKVESPWDETLIDKENIAALEDSKRQYKYVPMWEPKQMTPKQLEMLKKYQLVTPYERQSGASKVESRKVSNVKKTPATIAPWLQGQQEGPPPPSTLAPNKPTALWDTQQNNSKAPSMTIESSGDPVLDSLRWQLKQRGAMGILGLARKFKIMDDNGNGSLDLAEFKKAMKECNISDISDKAMSHLFRYFDIDDSGSINYNELLVGIRGVLNKRRRDMVEMAFKIMDRDGSGVIEWNDIEGVYNAKSNPDVIAGRKTDKEVVMEFLSSFEKPSRLSKSGGVFDGQISIDDFMNYYSNVSSSIDDDDYFELMIRNSWHISGGEGWSANTTNKRVLVTHFDGRQTVEEIKNDIGLKTNDKVGMVQRLRNQGIAAATMNTNGATDGGNGRGGDGSSDADLAYIASKQLNISQPPLAPATGASKSTYVPLHLQRLLQNKNQTSQPTNNNTTNSSMYANVKATTIPAAANKPKSLADLLISNNTVPK